MDTVIHNVSVYDQYVNEYVHKFMDLALYKDSFHTLLEHLPLNSKILELGCGPGNVIRYLKEQRPDLSFTGIDLSPEMIAVAQKTNPDETFHVMDIRNIRSINETYDAVITAFALPYLTKADLAPLFVNLEKLTAEKGLIYLSCMEGNSERPGVETTSFTGRFEMFITYYNREEIKSMFEAYGFTVIKFSTQDYPERDGSVTTEMIFTAMKN